MRIDVQVDTSELILKLERGEKRLAFGVAAAINSTAKRIQAEERRNLRRQMTVRKAFVERQVAVIKPFASAAQGRPYAEISVGQRPRLLLSIFERGGKREPFKGKRVAVPITGGPARPSFEDPVQEEYRFTKLRLRKTRPAGLTKSGRTRRQRGGQGVRFGERHTYLVPDVGVFQRQEDGTSKLLYVLKDEPKLDATLEFEKTARRVADRWFPEEMQRETVEALRRSGFR